MPQSQSVQDAVDHFRRLPWCARLIDAPGVKAIMPVARRLTSSRSGGRSESQDQLFRSALNNAGGVRCMLAIHPDPDAADAPPVARAAAAAAAASSGPTLSIASASLFLDLGEGVRGFSGFVHGGFLGAAMDEAMGTLIFSNYEYQRAQEDKAARASRGSGGSGDGGHYWAVPPGVLDMNTGVRIMTASMNVRFVRPVSVNSTVVATATLNRIDGRKIYVDVVVRDETGAACSTCEGMWVTSVVLPPPPPRTKPQSSL